MWILCSGPLTTIYLIAGISTGKLNPSLVYDYELSLGGLLSNYLCTSKPFVLDLSFKLLFYMNSLIRPLKNKFSVLLPLYLFYSIPELIYSPLNASVHQIYKWRLPHNQLQLEGYLKANFNSSQKTFFQSDVIIFAFIFMKEIFSSEQNLAELSSKTTKNNETASSLRRLPAFVPD